MARLPDEIDYLAGAKANPKKPPFAEVVREVFALEYGCVEDQHVAERVGVSGGRISQILKHPEALKVSTVRRLIKPLTSYNHQRAILKAWEALIFRDDLVPVERMDLIGGKADETTLRRIDRLVAARRPDRALRITEQALALSTDADFDRRLCDRAFVLYQWLDQPADAVTLAESFVTSGQKDNNLEQVATGLVMKAQVLRTLEGVPTTKIRSVQRDVLSIFDSLPKVRKSSRYFTVTRSIMQLGHIGTVLRHHEVHGGAEEAVRTSLRSLQTLSNAAESARSKAMTLNLAARIHLALHDYFKAEEVLEEAITTGVLAPGVNLKAGIVKARILAGRGNVEEAINYYEKLCALCEAERQLYLLRLSQRDLALLKAFPRGPT